MSAPSVSIIIVTLNRAESLRGTLASLRYLGYPTFEVIVVNGPSTDGTDEVVASFPEAIACRCPAPNLAQARNVGIAAARGDLVAFIDDDAIPEFGWLAAVTRCFDSPIVGAVGGSVLDHTGMAFQYQFSAVNRLGHTVHRSESPFDRQCFPGSFCVPYVQGTNATFRRSVLLQVGGFDETYEYFHDETDLCVRVADAGFAIRQLSGGVVHHKSAPSGVRTPQRLVTNLYPIVKNSTYFALRHASTYRTAEEIDQAIDACVRHWVNDLQQNAAAGLIDRAVGDAAGDRAVEARSAGIDAARSGPHFGSFVEQPEKALRIFPTRALTTPDRMILVGSSALDIAELPRPAPDMEQRMLIPTDSNSSVEFEDGMWVHRLQGEPLPATVATELKRIAQWEHRYRVAVHRSLGEQFVMELLREADAQVIAEQLTSDGSWLVCGRLARRHVR